METRQGERPLTNTLSVLTVHFQVDSYPRHRCIF